MCTLVPMRSVPHRVVCLVGLDDGAFPRGGAPDGDDLLLRTHHVGDHDRRAEDRQLLLDAVLAAGDTLVITYAGRDARTNEVLPPAVPVNELLDVIDDTVRSADGEPARRSVVRHHPLQPSDRRCFTTSALRATTPWGFDPQLLAGAKAAVAPQQPRSAFLASPLSPMHDTVIAVEDVVNVLIHPVRAFLRQRLGLSLRTYDDRPTDALVIDHDALARWGLGDRLLTALLAGADPDTVCAAELARGQLPPGDLGRSALADARAAAEMVATNAKQVADGPRTSLEVDVALPGGRQLVGTIPDVIGAVIRPVTFSRLGPKQQLRAWVHLLAATASHPGLSLTSVTVARGRDDTVLFGLPALTRDEAIEHLVDLVALRDEALCEPLPLYCSTSYRYASAARNGRRDPAEEASKDWTSGYGDWGKEDKDAEHVLVFGGERSFDEVSADPRFATLAARVWGPLLDAANRWRP
jgi:exodeoxyribonuclease V gamma subunit